MNSACVNPPVVTLAKATAMDGGIAGNAGAVFSARVHAFAFWIEWIPAYAGMTERVQ